MSGPNSRLESYTKLVSDKQEPIVSMATTESAKVATSFRARAGNDSFLGWHSDCSSFVDPFLQKVDITNLPQFL